MAIDAKQEETVKLNEYIMMEQEKIIEARLKFEEDCDRFNKYVKDVDYQTELAHKEAEDAYKKRLELNEIMDKLQQEIQLNERAIMKADEMVKQYQESKDFVDKVVSLKVKPTQSPSKKGGSTLSSQVGSLKNPYNSTGHSFVQSEKSKQSSLANTHQRQDNSGGFFITEKDGIIKEQEEKSQKE